MTLLPRTLTALTVTAASAVAATALAAAPATADTPTTTSTTTSAMTSTAPDDGRLAWAPPALVDPTVVQVTNASHDLRLDRARDYVVQMPATPLVAATGLTIYGGHNVVLVGGRVQTQGRGLYLKSQTGTVHVEGLRLSGAGATEGIDLSEPQSTTVQIEDVAVDTVHGSRTTNHADVLQTWSGPGALRVDRLDGSTTYQGFFLAPAQFGSAPDSVDVRRSVLRCAPSGCGYLLWQSGTFPVTTSDVTVVPGTRSFPGQVLWAPSGATPWAAVAQGGADTPSPLVGTPGTGYTSPGYADAAAAAGTGRVARPASGTTRAARTPALLRRTTAATRHRAGARCAGGLAPC